MVKEEISSEDYKNCLTARDFFFGVSIIIQGFSKKKFIVHESIFSRSQKCSPVRENVLGV
jgi:hypothetical protein